MANPTDHAPDDPAAALPDWLASDEYRLDGPSKVRGAAAYAADVRLPGMLWARLLRSPVPHARIAAVDTSAARQVPGVHAVLTGADVRPARFGRRLLDWPVLCWDRVRFIGDRVAAVAAETREAADEAVEAIRVEYEELPAILTPREALAPNAPVLHPEAAEYVYIGGERPPVPHANLQGYLIVRKGDADLEPLFARADHVFEHTFTTPRQHHGYLEPHATVVWIEGDRVHVISTNKTPFSLRTQLALAAGLDPRQIVVDSRFIGGDFGGKGLSPDEPVCYFLARATGRPVRAVMTYEEELQACNTRHASAIRLRTAVTREGRIVAHQAEVVFDGGAYAAAKPMPPLVPLGGLATLAPYHVPHSRLEVSTVYTNTVPAGHMRAPGEVQALFAGESHVDMIAHALGMDPLQFRLLNAVRGSETGAAGDRFREPRAVEVLERLREETGWGTATKAANVGRGIALGVRHIGRGKASVILRLERDGVIRVTTGTPQQGTGAHTAIQRVAAVVLSVGQERVRVEYGSTDAAPFDPGAGGSRVTHVVGRAVEEGASRLKARLEELAAEVLGWPAGEVRLEAEHFTLVGRPEAVAFDKVARQIASGAPVEVSGSYDSTSPHADEPGDFNFHACALEVEVDPDTGQLRVRDALLVADVGTILNPVAHRGQLEGGFAFGLGAALMEELVVEGGQVVTAHLGDYKLPTQLDLPPLRVSLLPTRVGPGPFGAKMAGELSNTAVAPALANAVADAVGARVTSLPVTAERVCRALGRTPG